MCVCARARVRVLRACVRVEAGVTRFVEQQRVAPAGRDLPTEKGRSADKPEYTAVYRIYGRPRSADRERDCVKTRESTRSQLRRRQSVICRQRKGGREKERGDRKGGREKERGERTREEGGERKRGESEIEGREKEREREREGREKESGERKRGERERERREKERGGGESGRHLPLKRGESMLPDAAPFVKIRVN